MNHITPEMVSAALAVADEFERDLNLGDRGARAVVRQMLRAAFAVAPLTTNVITIKAADASVIGEMVRMMNDRGAPCS